MEKYECKRLNSLIKRLQKIYPELSDIDCIKLRHILFQTFIEIVEAYKNEYILNMSWEEYIKWAINQVSHQDPDQDHRKANGKPTD